MKNKNNTSSQATITKQDLKNLQKDISEDFGKVLDGIMTQIAGNFQMIDRKFDQVDKRFDEQNKIFDVKFKKQEELFDNKFDSKFNQLRRDLLDSNLQIIDELRLSREEGEVRTHRQNIRNNQIEKNSNEIAFLKSNCVLKYH